MRWAVGWSGSGSQSSNGFDRSGRGDGALGPAQRLDALERLATERFDVLVIGGGVTGSGCALDAASRGLNVGLIEQRDLASGTSSRSSKLIHGGLRYLEQLDLGLVAEALRERSLMLHTVAPHLVRPVPFLYPLQHRVWERAYVGAGIALYDLLARRGTNPLPRHRHLSWRSAQAQAPGVAADRLVGAVKFWDAQVDDARHTMFVARTAAAHGAAIASSVRARGLVMTDGRVSGVQVRCGETGRELVIEARVVVNATASWTDQIQAMAGQPDPRVRAQPDLRVRASKGVHLVVHRDRIPGDVGLITRTSSSVLFVIPWGERWLIGTTDTDWDLDLAHPAASRTDIDYLLAEANRWLADPLGPEDVIGVYAGLRPLLEGESDDTSSLTRKHAVHSSAPGMVTVAGGKYTTYRVMAADAIDAATAEAGIRVGASVTSALPLLGAPGLGAFRDQVAGLAVRHGLGVAQIERLAGRYGTLTPEVLDLVTQNPDLGRPVTDDTPYLGAELVYGARCEGALHLDDLLTRRTRISVESAGRGADVAPHVASLVAGELGWDRSAVRREVDHYRARVDAELVSQTMATDRSADAARLDARDVRVLDA